MDLPTGTLGSRRERLAWLQPNSRSEGASPSSRHGARLSSMNRMRLPLLLLAVGVFVVMALIARQPSMSAARRHSPLDVVDRRSAPAEQVSTRATGLQELQPRSNVRVGTADDSDVSLGTVTFVAIDDGSGLAYSRWGFQSPNAGQIFLQADESGMISLPPSLWTITQCPDGVASAFPREFRVRPTERTLVRAALIESISLRVIDSEGPLEGVYVEWLGAEWLGGVATSYAVPPGRLTNADGIASFDQVPLSLLGRAVASKPGYHPTRQAILSQREAPAPIPHYTATMMMCRADDPSSILLRCVDDRMTPCASLRLRAVFDLMDWADASPTNLGTTDVRGELRADDWLTTACAIETADPEERSVYPCRYTWPEKVGPGSTIHLTLPRRAPGRLELGESMNGHAVEVRVSPPGDSESGIALLPRLFTLTVADGSVAIDLPMLAGAIVDVMDQDGRTWSEVVVAEYPDWRERVIWRDPDQTLTLVAHGSDIDTVTSSWVFGGNPIPFVKQDADRTTIRLSSQVSSLVVSSMQGQRVSLSRRIPCSEDVLDVQFDPLVHASFEVRDASGDLIPDVAIRFRQLTVSPPRNSRRGCWRQDSQSVFRATTGADGVIQCWMPAGDYEVKARQPPWRECLDFGHLVQSPPGGTVSVGPRTTTITLVASRPRRLIARWAEHALVSLPPRWSLYDAELDQWQVFQGHEAVVWITEEARELGVRDDKGTTLETLAVPAGAGDVEVILGNE